MTSSNSQVKVAVIGAGWWTQGWHLVHLNNNPDVQLVAVVDTQAHPQSKLNPSLAPLQGLAEKYQCRTYNSLETLLLEQPDMDGILICTPHATHFELGLKVLRSCTERRERAGDDNNNYKPIHILMEKPMTTCATQALDLYTAVQTYTQRGGKGTFLVNHTANYRPQAKLAREIVRAGKLGTIRHVTAFFASPLSWIFDDPSHTGWNEPTGGMLGNGFGWGQQTHVVAWIWHVTGLQATTVYCQMTHSETTGADVAQAATITCTNGAVVSISGTSVLPGHAHSDPPVGKRVVLEIYGSKGALLYSGIDTDPSSGKLELVDPDGKSEIVCDSFLFEDLDNTGIGPASLQSWIAACQGKDDYENGADSALGLQTIQTVAAMYESHATKQVIVIPSDSK
jgi:predicted dehydrogenase